MADRLLIIAVLLAVPLLLIGLPLYLLFGGLRSFARRPLERCFEGIELHEKPVPGDVAFVYHTYRGFLLWWLQEEHRVIAPLPDAERLLGRLLRFNLTWGLLSKAMLFVPPLALGNYYAQRRSIKKQAEAAAAGTSKAALLP
jgi:hypothetical protein